MSFSVHIDEKSTDLPARKQAAGEIGPWQGCDDDETPSPRFFLGIAWALGLSAVVWGVVLIVAMLEVR